MPITTPPSTESTDPVVDAAVEFVAQAPGPLAIVPLEDIMGTTEQPNLPGTIDEHPNWRRRLEPPAREMFEAPAVRHRIDIIRRHRK